MQRLLGTMTPLGHKVQVALVLACTITTCAAMPARRGAMWCVGEPLFGNASTTFTSEMVRALGRGASLPAGILP
jgi:hypothetical protein